MSVATTVCGCKVERWLTAGRTALIEAPWTRVSPLQGRWVDPLLPAPSGTPDRLVVKRLEDDLLLGEDLHPLVRDRLAKLRELPLAGVSLPLGVWADETADGRVETGSVWTLWHWVEGRELLPDDSSAGRISAIALAAFEALERLHDLGLAHGAIHRGNVLVAKRDTFEEGRERVILTHPSPLLVTDTEADVRGMCRVFRDVLSHEESSEPLLRHLMARQSAENAGDGAGGVWTARRWRLELAQVFHAPGDSGLSVLSPISADAAQTQEVRLRTRPVRVARRAAWVLLLVVAGGAGGIVAGFLAGW